MADFINLSGLWKVDGKTHYSGYLKVEDIEKLLVAARATGKIKFFLNKNNKRPGKNDPDLKLSALPAKQKQFEVQGAIFEKEDEDDLPF
jgi:hypothetical protein